MSIIKIGTEGVKPSKAWFFKFIHKTTCFSVINGSSMEPTLHDGDLAVINKKRNFNRGDIVIIAVIRENGYLSSIVKRIVGLPGDEIVVRNSDSAIMINGVFLYEPYTKKPIRMIKDDHKGNSAKLTRIPKDCIYVLGDNRQASQDSRAFGVVPLKHVLSRVSYISRRDGTRHNFEPLKYVGLESKIANVPKFNIRDLKKKAKTKYKEYNKRCQQ